MCTALRCALLCLYLAISAYASAEGSHDKACYVYHTSPWGFGSNFYGIAMAVAAYGLKNSTIYLDESEWSYKCQGKASWNVFFAGTQPHYLPDPESPIEKDCISISYHSAYEQFRNLTVDHVRPLIGKALQKVWTLSERLQKLADKQAAFMETLRRPVLAMHVRSGDKESEDIAQGRNPGWFKTSDWLSSLKEHLELFELPAPATCLIYGDALEANAAVAATAARNLSCAVLQFGGRNGGHQQNLFGDDAVDPEHLGEYYCSSTEDVILHVIGMARADLFVGSYNSNLPRIVHLLRKYVYRKPPSSTKDILYREWHHDHHHKISSRAM